MGKTNMDILEKLETLGTQDEDKHYKNNLEVSSRVSVLCHLGLVFYVM